MKKAEKLKLSETKATPWKVVVAAQRLKRLAFISSQARQSHGSNGQEASASTATGGENVVAISQL